MNSPRRAGVLVLVSVLVGLAAIGATPALAAQAPRWSLSFSQAPSELLHGKPAKLVVSATNLSDANVNAASDPVTIKTELPSGVRATEAVGRAGYLGGAGHRSAVVCTVPSSSEVVCTYTEGAGSQETGQLPPYERLEIEIGVDVGEAATSGEAAQVSVSGGGVAAVSASESLTIGSGRTEFGIGQYELVPENEDGSPDTQAGSHPERLTSTIAFNQEFESGLARPAALVRNLNFDLPVGLVGNPTAIAQCTTLQFTTFEGSVNSCPADTAIGVAAVTIIEPRGTHFGFHPVTMTVPVFNLTPGAGEPARFGFEAIGVPAIFDTAVRTGEGYGVQVRVHEISQVTALLGAQLTLWGVPGDPSHDQSRGWGCIDAGYWSKFNGETCQPSSEAHPAPFLTLPTACGSLASEAFQTTVEGESWQAPGEPPVEVGSVSYRLHEADGTPLALDGCNRLPFHPAIEVAPDREAASTPAGLGVTVRVPQEGTRDALGLADADVKDTEVALPSGVQLSPAGAGGLAACSEQEVGFTGTEPASGTEQFTPALTQPFCPDASKVGTARIKTPLLPDPLEGAVYLATQGANPFGSLVAMYIVAQDPVSGTLVKLAGEVMLNEDSGQIVSAFDNTPQLPFEVLELHFFGGERAPLTTPPTCGAYTTSASFTPWSDAAPAQAQSVFTITSGPNGSPCAVPQPFAPGFAAGASDVEAGMFTPFTMTVTRPDADQALGGISLHLPPGLLGTIASTQLCEEPQATAGTCGAGSLIGRVRVDAGLGQNPYVIEGGKVFITGPIAGAPYGLSIVVPTVAGPFTLKGNTGRGQEVVRAKIEVDPRTAALTVSTIEPLPSMLEGIPLQLQRIEVTTERPGGQGFTFNPTNCGPEALVGIMTSSVGASAQVSSPFQVTDCARLAFKPAFTVSTSGRTSRLDGASLHVKLTYPKAPWGSAANLAKVRVELPRKLPSRLKTLQKACSEGAFAAGPATHCPAASIVGEATVHTPVLPDPLHGNAYFVSHGGAQFPELVIVLEGDGVTIELHGETFISKKGITSSTFKQTPDVPFSSFELSLPAGPYSALAANGDLCRKKSLGMPTELVAQDGARVKDTTKVAVTGCPKPRRARPRRTSRPSPPRPRR
jgi:hypothetical protein